MPRQTFLGRVLSRCNLQVCPPLQSTGWVSAAHRWQYTAGPQHLEQRCSALLCQPRAVLQTAHQSPMSCPALEADFTMGHQSNHLVAGTSLCSEQGSSSGWDRS